MINKQLKKPKVIVIGLDGGSWNIINPLIAQSKLPTIGNLIKNGTYSDLESSIPYYTFPAWKCYSTGKNPGKLGVYGFMNIDVENKKFTFNNSMSFHSKEIWDYLKENNISCGILGMPTTYPPKKVNGFMVSEFNPKNSEFTYPSNLKSELYEKFKYKEYIIDYHGSDKSFVEKFSLNSIKQRFDASNYLIKKYKPVFFHITIFHLDPLQHFYWKFMDNNDKNYGKTIEKSWIFIDAYINEFLNKNNIDIEKNSDVYVIIMSDHGFTKLKAIFNINQWLLDKKYLLLKSNSLISKIYSFFTKFISIEFFHKTMKLPIIGDIIHKIIKDKQRHNIIQEMIDWDKSRVIPNSQSPLYINKKLFNSNKDYENFREKLIKEIKEIKNPKTNENLVKEVYKKEELYKGDLGESPDLILLPNEGYEIYLSFDDNIWVFEPKEEGWSGIHKLHGIFCISGPGIKKNQEIKNAKIIDITPTILHLFNIPIPDDMDGRVLTECFKEDSELAKRKIVFQDVKKIEKLKDKIKRLKKEQKI